VTELEFCLKSVEREAEASKDQAEALQAKVGKLQGELRAREEAVAATERQLEETNDWLRIMEQEMGAERETMGEGMAAASARAEATATAAADRVHAADARADAAIQSSAREWLNRLRGLENDWRARLSHADHTWSQRLAAAEQVFTEKLQATVEAVEAAWIEKLESVEAAWMDTLTHAKAEAGRAAATRDQEAALAQHRSDAEHARLLTVREFRFRAWGLRRRVQTAIFRNTQRTRLC
jgi:hypothetical protein